MCRSSTHKEGGTIKKNKYKNEFHQPGDVEVSYEKTENENQKKKRTMIQQNNIQDNTENQIMRKTPESANVPKPTETNIRDFILRMREIENKKTTNENKDTTEDEGTLSSQEMIDDARERRLRNAKINQCEQCEFKSASKTLLIRHQQSVHEGNKYKCDQCEHIATTKGSLEMHKGTHHIHQCNQCDYKDETKGGLTKHKESIHDNKSKYVSKRIQCENCEKKFNKRETFKIHMEKFHSINITRNKNETQSQTKSIIQITE